MGRIGITQPQRARIQVGIKQRHEPMRLRQVFLRQLVEVVKNPIRWQTAENLRAQHPAQHRHQQTSGHALAHDITHHQGPATPLTASTDEFRTGGNEVVVVTAHLKCRPTARGQINALDHGATVGQQLGLNLCTNAELSIHPLMPAGVLQHLIVFDRDTSKIRHQLNVPTMHLGPDQRAVAGIDVKATPRPTTGRHRRGEQSRFGQAALNQTVERQQLLIVAAKTHGRSRFKSG